MEKEEGLLMAKPKKSEEIFLEGIFIAGKVLKKTPRSLSGTVVPLIRRQLGMSQRILAARAGIQQSSVARIESGHFNPNISTLKKIVKAMECDLMVTIFPKTDFKNHQRNPSKIKGGTKSSLPSRNDESGKTGTKPKTIKRIAR